MNVVSLIGNLATDVDLKEVGDGKQVASFVLAVDRHSKDAGADFVPVTAWEKQAELSARFLSKGKRIGLDGRLRSRSWEDGEGKKRTALDVVAHRVEFLFGRDGTSQETPFEAVA